jgi:hypothetical protein
LRSSPTDRRWAYLDLADFLLIGEAALGVSAEDLARVAHLNLAASALDAPAAEFGGVEFYPEFPMKAARAPGTPSGMRKTRGATRAGVRRFR